MSSSDPDMAYNLFVEKFMMACSKYIQPKHIRSKKLKRPWMTEGLVVSIEKRDRMFKLLKRQPFNTQLRERYDTYKSQIKILCRKAERCYFETRFKHFHGDGRRTWGTINEALKRKKSKAKAPQQLYTENGEKITDKTEISEHFNRYFTNIGQNLSSKFGPNTNPKKYDFKPENVIRSFTSISSADVTKHLKNLDIRKSPGVDKIHPKLLREAAHVVTEPLTYIFNLSITKDIVPSKLKSARILPIFKGTGNPELPGNYRPISILPACSKILEKIIYNQMIQILGDDCLFERQYGFRRGLGTTEAIRNLVDGLHKSLHAGNINIGIFIDFKKAFDTVNHEILINKLEGYGFTGVAKRWLEDYLKNRNQMVKINNKPSSKLSVKVGVPQGSILGPLLFLLYINDMKEYIKHGTWQLFADDTNIFYNTKDIEIAIIEIHEDMVGLNKWLEENKLTVNTS